MLMAVKSTANYSNTEFNKLCVHLNGRSRRCAPSLPSHAQYFFPFNKFDVSDPDPHKNEPMKLSILISSAHDPTRLSILTSSANFIDLSGLIETGCNADHTYNKFTSRCVCIHRRGRMCGHSLPSNAQYSDPSKKSNVVDPDPHHTADTHIGASINQKAQT